MRETNPALFISVTPNFMSLSTDRYLSILKSVSNFSTLFPYYISLPLPSWFPLWPCSLHPSPSRQQMLRLWPDVLSLLLSNHVFSKFSYGKHLQGCLCSSANTLTLEKSKAEKQQRFFRQHLHLDLTVTAANTNSQCTR